MKKYFQAIFVAALAVSAQAAEYKPLLEEGKSWIMARAWYNSGIVYPATRMDEYVIQLECTVDEPVEIEGEQCWRLIVKELGSDKALKNNLFDVDDWIFREKDGELSLYAPYENNPNESNFVTVWNIDCNEGDSLLIEGDYPNKNPATWLYHYISEVKTTKDAEGAERIEQIIDWVCDPYRYNLGSFVEGIGSATCSPLMFFFDDFRSIDGGIVYYMIECRKDGKTIFTNDDFTVPYRYGLQTVRNITPGKSWTMARGHDEFTVSVERDTLISGVSCTILKSSEGKEYIVAEEQGRVYYLPEHLGPANPLLMAIPIGGGTEDGYKHVKRMEMSTGSIVSCPIAVRNEYLWTGSGINRLTVGGRAFSEYLFEDSEGEVVASWVDGVGAPDSRSWAVVMPEDFEPLRMIDCRQDGEVIFTAEDFTYQSSISEVTAPEAARRGIYDLQGRRVATPTRGLYIVDGQKRLIR